MEKIKEVINKIKEFINSFTNPVEPEKSFAQLAVEAGVSPDAIKKLKESMNGVKNWKFAEDFEEPKKRKNKIELEPSSEVQPVQGIPTNIKFEKERD